MVSGLRRSLGPDGARLTRVGRGYRLEAAVDEVDLLRCKAVVNEARLLARSGRDTAAVEAYRRALAEWGGPALAGLSGRSSRRSRTPGRVPPLPHRGAHRPRTRSGPRRRPHRRTPRLLEAHPLRQRFTAQLMLALYRAGRAPEALQVYAGPGTPRRRPRRRPRPRCATSTPRSSATARPTPPRAPPAETPPAPRPRPPPARQHPLHRPRQLAMLDGLLADGEAASPRSPAWAASARPRSRSAGPTASPTASPTGSSTSTSAASTRSPPPPTEPLAPSSRPWASPTASRPRDERIGLYRTLLAQRRVLVVLDNARDAAQVRPLLPVAPGSFTLVTSRDRLSGLDVTEGAGPSLSELLSEADAWALLVRRIGNAAPWPKSDPGRIVAACARLPLALNLIGAGPPPTPAFPRGPGRPPRARHQRLQSPRLSRHRLRPALDLRLLLPGTRGQSRTSVPALRPPPRPRPHRPGAAGLMALPTADAEAALHELAGAPVDQPSGPVHDARPAALLRRRTRGRGRRGGPRGHGADARPLPPQRPRRIAPDPPGPTRAHCLAPRAP